ncbi:hypothetical protein EJB05_16321, partial [Eragrostis curvula]
MAAPSFFRLPFLLTITAAIITTIPFACAQRQSGKGCIEAEREALLSFKASIKRDPVNRLGSWKGHDCCKWDGVHCSNVTGHVVKLNLSNTNPKLFGNEFSDLCLSGENSRFSNPNGLLGKIDSSLIALQHLNYLDLSGNYLGGGVPIPRFIGSLRKTHLNLACMNFAGRVPPQLGNLTRLLYLNIKSPISSIFYDDVVHSDDISWLPHLGSLRFLDMSGVNLSNVGDWVRMVTFLPSLKVLRLSYCELSLPHESRVSSNISSLETLDLMLYNTDTLDPAYWFWNADTIKELELAFNQITGPIPVAIGNMTSLEKFSLGGNQKLTGIKYKLSDGLCYLIYLDISSTAINQDMAEFMDLLPSCSKSKLQFLDLSSSNLTGQIPKWVNHWGNLSDLFLSENRLQGSVPREIGTLANLRRLYLDNNQFTGSISEEHLANLANLEELDLSYNSLHIKISSNWFPQFSLQYVYFARCKMGPHIPLWLKEQTSVTHLDISDADIVDHLPSWFWSVFSQAHYLNLSSNKIKGRLPATLEFMSSLSMLDLSSNSLTGSIPLELTGLQNLQILDLAHNRISGTVPHAIANLKAMAQNSRRYNPLMRMYVRPITVSVDIEYSVKYDDSLPLVTKGQEIDYTSTMKYMVGLDLSCNNLVGEIPGELASLVELINLNMSHNQLSGEIPEKIGLLRALESLDLSFNELSGEIPWSLSEITSLSHLNLTYNNLSGRIPLGNQLQTLGDPASIYIGNNYLCGPPLSRNCSEPDATEDYTDVTEPNKRDFHFGWLWGMLWEFGWCLLSSCS